MHRLAPYIILALTALFGGVSLFAFWLFLLFGPLLLAQLSVGETPALALNTTLSALFFLQHSGMIRRRFKAWSARYVPPHYQGALFTATSGVTLLVLLIFWQESGHTIVTFHGIPRWILRGVHALAIAGFAWGGLALAGADTFGLAPILAQSFGTRPPRRVFSIRGPYRWVRHPLYLFTLMMIWSYPGLTTDRLLFNILWTAWILLGAVLEERDLVAEFGQPYRDYQSTVPMLIPHRLAP